MQITELKAANFTTETECREKLKQAQREFDSKTETLQNKVKTLQKEIATLSKFKNKSSLTIVRGGDSAPSGGLQAAINKIRDNNSSDDSS